ncbi:MAG TPA: F0F1 ATP synthase subunit delta [Candidatus Saccharimonadales bacterium]|nr:F0F1 ATP synthase subunit delta [Candidatus Saccharimonadales bacterium]
MATRLSRKKIAEYAAERLIKNDTKVLLEVAAFLVENRRTRELELLVRDIEYALSTHGVVIADVTSAYPLSETLKNNIKELVGGKQLILRETVDPAVLGGIRLTTPGERLDATLKRKIQALKA